MKSWLHHGKYMWQYVTVPFVLHNKSSLGNYAEQCGEAIHHKFKKTWSNYKRSVGHDNYDKNLKSAVVHFSSMNK